MRTQRILVAMVAAAVVAWLSACGATPPSTDPPTGGGPTVGEPNVISGVLRDASGAPLADQQVSVGRMPSELSASTLSTSGAQRASVATTDATGTFRIPVTSAGTYGVASLTDTTGAFKTVTVERDGDGTLRQTESVTMATAPLGAIAGSVDGPGAGVFVFALGTSFSAVTDASGDFVIGRVPAGTYLVVAGTPGSVTSGVTVSVSAGAVATLDAPIVFGPRVSGVDPDGFVTLEVDFDLDALVSPRTFTISGSGFGATQGIGILRYVGGNVDNAIVSWTDTAIVVDVEMLERSDSVATPPRIVAGATPDAFRFEVITPAGAATSPPVGYLAPDLLDPRGAGREDVAEAPSDTRLGVAAQTLRAHQMAGVTFAVTVHNGSARSSDDDLVIDSVTTAAVGGVDAWHPYAATLDVRQASGLPAVVTIDPSGDPRFAAIEPVSMAVAGELAFDVAAAVYGAGAVTITGSVFGWDGLPMPDDGAFELQLGAWTQEQGAVRASEALTIDADGSFIAVVPFEDVTKDDPWIGVTLRYLGYAVAGSGAEVTE